MNVLLFIARNIVMWTIVYLLFTGTHATLAYYHGMTDTSLTGVLLSWGLCFFLFYSLKFLQSRPLQETLPKHHATASTDQ